MFTTNLVIATIAVTIGTGLGYLLTRPTITRLRADLTAASWHLTHDPLTGLLNRTGLQTAHAYLAASAGTRQVAVILVDLDHFKEINDNHGHAAGDDVLKNVAHRLAELADFHDGYAARLSGDEFVIVYPLGDHGAGASAELIGGFIAAPIEIPTDTGLVTKSITASLGVTVIAADQLANVALRQADTAMYHAKHGGGDRHAIYQPGQTMPGREPHRRGPRQRDLRRREGNAK
ncbi:hypothetical protein Aca07nite_72090 [Actinoplanes capillaceus]|uniref:GGDEF domain-containing protein n=1 Tax=Actinoplanes campanulatus TaxID=113559 RepID=A0ABQ3WUS7_9ACTN|nr:GGDEF domain-containing protein [Actinoplanes capillaceus]GID49934.1 hypothetical protein Aca07nite_72090 [Actinoplanes capillaceus]